MATRDSLLELQNKISQTVLGQEVMIERLLIGLLANGNLLVEGLPGLAKTRAIKKLSSFLDAGLSRIQFTPDLLPSDITGSEIYYTSDGKGEFAFSLDPFSITSFSPTRSIAHLRRSRPHYSKRWKSVR